MDTITFTIDDETKKQLDEILEKLGIDLETFVNAFLCKVIECKGLPFKIE